MTIITITITITIAIITITVFYVYHWIYPPIMAPVSWISSTEPLAPAPVSSHEKLGPELVTYEMPCLAVNRGD